MSFVSFGTIRRTGADLRRIGIEVPQQLGALFLMDGDEIDRITQNIAPLTDNYPKRLTDGPWDDEATHRFALTYFTAPAAFQRFVGSPLINQIWPGTLNPADAGLESFFTVRQTRYISGNGWKQQARGARSLSPRFPFEDTRSWKCWAAMRSGFPLPSECAQEFRYTAAGNHARLDRRGAGAAEYRPRRLCYWRARKIAACSVFVKSFCLRISTA